MSTSKPPPKKLGLGRMVKERIKRYLYPDYLFARRQYFHRNGFYPNLLAPRDLSEKVLWLKLHDRSPLHTRCADKILARDYVAALAGADLLAPTLLVTYDPDDVTPQAIREERFVVKTNHDQGGVFICRDRATFAWEDMRAQLKRRAKENKYYEFRERQYKDIRPGILVERFLEGENGGDVLELKVNCFHGKPTFVQAIVERFRERRHVNYDLDWRRMALHGRTPEVDVDLPRPRNLERVLSAAAALSAPFLFCRIDFLVDGNGRPWFSEITFHPAAGLVRYRPNEMERALGDLLDLSRIDESRRMQREVWQATRKLHLGKPPSDTDEP